MGVKRKESGKYRVRVVKAKVFKDREVAKKYDASLRQAVYKADQDFMRGIVHSAVINWEKIEEFIEYRRINDRLTPATLQNYRQRLMALLEIMGRETLQDITREDIFLVKKELSDRPGKNRSHQKSVGLSPDTINQYLQVLRQYIEWARNVRYEVQGMLPCETALTPVRTREKIAGGRYVPEVLYPEQIKELLQVLRSYNLYVWAMMVAVWCTARRPCQLAQICWRDYTAPLLTESGVLRIVGGKGGPAGSIPVRYGGMLHRVISELEEEQQKIRLGGWLFCTPSGNMWQISYLGNRFKRAVRDSEEYCWVRPYVVKHSAITYMQECDGITPAMVQKQAGHTRITSQEAYTHRDRTQLDLSVGVLEAAL